MKTEMTESADGGSKRKRPVPRELTLEVVKPHFEQPLREAAAELNVSINYLKRACRKAGIKRWPYKKVGTWRVAMAIHGLTFAFWLQLVQLRGVRTALAGLLQQAKSGRDNPTIETIIASLREEEATLLQGITTDGVVKRHSALISRIESV